VQHILRTDNVEKMPDTLACRTGAARQEACAPGFFDAALPLLSLTNASSSDAHACCPGYFCPPQLTW
jgi:hypothetical protein